MVGFRRQRDRFTPSQWHPDMDTAVVWSAYARRQRREEWIHRAKVVAAVLVLSAAGFAAVIFGAYLLGR